MVDSYSKHISDIIYDTKNYEIEVLFYLTQHCNLRCRGCYMLRRQMRPGTYCRMRI